MGYVSGREAYQSLEGLASLVICWRPSWVVGSR
jgi:hypothetical protein